MPSYKFVFVCYVFVCQDAKKHDRGLEILELNKEITDAKKIVDAKAEDVPDADDEDDDN